MSGASYIPGGRPDETETILVDDGASAPPQGRLARWLGACVSLGLVIGVSVWAYDLIQRDVSGLPVVRAVEGPMRMAPEDPGGRQAHHQGLAVNDVAGSGAAAPTADSVRLAPPPLALTEDDKPMGDLRTAEAAPAPKIEPPMSDEARVAFRQGAVDALLAELTGQPLDADTAVVQRASLQIEAEEVAIDPADLKPLFEAATGNGIARSLRPQSRPVTLAAYTPTTTVAAPAPQAVREVDASSLAPGTRLAQLGTYDSAESARADWARIAGRFEDYMTGKARVVQATTNGNRTFYRLRAAGFQTLDDARRFCSALMAEKADCITVTVR
jgi:hypothetical protein